ncbi:BTB/POZ domain-containing protein [Ditylenchus destructor]|nr:BTB/POZ domain-containing protein [Ditylenchus destructor]
MGQTNSANNSNWIRLNVGGEIFQTTKQTLSRHPDSYLARLVNGDLPSDKDESGAYVVDRSPKHFETIMTYLRRGVLNLDGNEETTKELLDQAEFYKIQPLIDEIRKAMRPVNSNFCRFNVGGNIFQTRKDTLSRYPDSLLARWANGDLPSDKDETGAILIGRSYEHFETILNYFRPGVFNLANLDRSEKAMKDLLCEADFYNIQPLVDEIRNAMGLLGQ